MVENNNDNENKVDIPKWVTDSLEINRKENLSEIYVRHQITQEEAIDIANLDENLKNDFFKRSYRRGISFIAFTNEKTKLVKKNNRIYWLVQILGGEISQIESDGHGGEIFSDGIISKDELRKLRCLIDVQTGEYIYYPKRRFFNFGDDNDYDDDYDKEDKGEW